MQFSFYWWHSDYTKALSFFSARSSVLLSVRLYQKINETLCFIMTQKLFRLLEIHLLHSELSAMIWYSNRVWRSFFQTLCRQNKKSRLNNTEFQELKEINFFSQNEFYSPEPEDKHPKRNCSWLILARSWVHFQMHPNTLNKYYGAIGVR